MLIKPWVHDTAGDRHARILRHPRIEPGRIALTLCTPHGLRRIHHQARSGTFSPRPKGIVGKHWPSEHAPQSLRLADVAHDGHPATQD